MPIPVRAALFKLLAIPRVPAPALIAKAAVAFRAPEKKGRDKVVTKNNAGNVPVIMAEGDVEVPIWPPDFSSAHMCIPEIASRIVSRNNRERNDGGTTKDVLVNKKAGISDLAVLVSLPLQDSLAKQRSLSLPRRKVHIACLAAMPIHKGPYLQATLRRTAIKASGVGLAFVLVHGYLIRNVPVSRREVNVLEDACGRLLASKRGTYVLHSSV